MGGGEAIQSQDLGDRRRRVGPDRVIAGGGGGDLGDPSHTHRMVVAARQQRLTGRRTQGGGVKPVEPQTAVGQTLGVGRAARAAEHARRPEPGIVDHYHHHIRRLDGRPQGRDRRVGRLGILGIIGGQPHVPAAGIGKWLRAISAMGLLINVRRGHNLSPRTTSPNQRARQRHHPEQTNMPSGDPSTTPAVGMLGTRTVTNAYYC